MLVQTELLQAMVLLIPFHLVEMLELTLVVAVAVEHTKLQLVVLVALEL
jgi:hypothetical protein